MKQFTRRHSAKQQQQSASVCGGGQPEQQLATKQPAAAPPQPPPSGAAHDPYAFVLEEEVQQQQQPQPGISPDLLAGSRASGALSRDQQAPAPSSKRAPAAAPKAPVAAAAGGGGSSKCAHAPRQRASPVKAAKAAPPTRPPAAATVPAAAAAASEPDKPAAPPARGTSKPAAAPATAAVANSNKAQPPAAAAAAAARPTTAGSAGSGGSSARIRAPPPPTAAAPPPPGDQAGASQPSSASGGSSRRSQQQQTVAGVKRSRAGSNTATATGSQQEQQQEQQQPSQGQPAPQNKKQRRSATSAVPAAAAGIGVTLPTPHRRSRLVSTSLLAATAAAAGEARPAQTVMEAQERGEQVQLQDDARYAMDGLAPSCSLDTQRDSAATLTEMLSTRKGRTALRADGLAQQFLTSLAKLKAGKDCVLALAGTLSLLSLTAEDANPCYLKSVAAAVLLDQLLQNDYSFDDVAEAGAAGAKLCRLIRVRPLANVLSSTGVTTTRGLLCIALEQATNTQQASKASAVEKLKHNLRQHGALARMAGLVADTLVAPEGPLAAAKELHVLLSVLENATFTCPDNGTALVALQVVPGAPKGSSSRPSSQQAAGGAADGGAAMSFPLVLVSIAQQLQQGVEQEHASAALHAALSVAMNLSHQNPAGGDAISAAGGMAVAAATLTQLLQPAQGCHDALCQAVLQHLELLSVSLGVLINLVSGTPENSRQLAAGGSGSNGAAGGSSGSGSSRRRGGGGGGQQQQQHREAPGANDLVQLLCTVMTAVGQLQQQQQQQEAAAAAGGGSPSSGRKQQLGSGDGSPPPRAASAAAAAAGGGGGGGSPGGGAAGLDDNTAGEASIVEVYCGMLLGFLVRDCELPLARTVAGRLQEGGNTLAPIISAIQRCLAFYVSTGAITEHTRAMLTQLLQHLGEAEAALNGSGGGEAGAAAAGGGEAGVTAVPSAAGTEAGAGAMEVE